MKYVFLVWSGVWRKRTLQQMTVMLDSPAAFPRFKHAVLASILIEGMLLALGAAIIGALIAWLVFDGRVINAEGLTFPLAVSPHLVLISIVWALVIGLIGGLLPAIRAARLPVAWAMRDA